jgi:hypothetical protein
VTEYGLSNGRVYESKEIRIGNSTRRVFLERLVKGDITLYYYRGKKINTFFILADSVFRELPRYDSQKQLIYKTLLKELSMKCPGISTWVSNVQYTRSSLTIFVQSTNNCDVRPIQQFRYGFLTGYNSERLSLPEKNETELTKFNFKWEGNMMLGFFADQPLPGRSFSILAQAVYTKSGFSYNYRSKYEDMDVVLNTSMISFPVSLKFSIPFMKSRPYIHAGGIYGFHLKNKACIYKSSISGNVVEVVGTNTSPIISGSQLGYISGAGFHYTLNSTKTLFFEIRYSKLFSNTDPELLTRNQFQIHTGINL